MCNCPQCTIITVTIFFILLHCNPADLNKVEFISLTEVVRFYFNNCLLFIWWLPSLIAIHITYYLNVQFMFVFRHQCAE